MNNIIPFKFDSLEIRAITREDGEPWFVAADVSAALTIGNTTDALRRLDADEQALVSIEGISRGNDQVNLINESGLYSLILGSRKPEAKRFKKWVTSEVLPSIRKTGRYQVSEAPPRPLSAVAQDIEALDMLARFLNVAPSGRIAMARVVLTQSAPHLLPALPVYAIDAPAGSTAGSTAGSSEPTTSLTALLKQSGLPMSTAKANLILEGLGLLEHRSRASSSGYIKTFWAVTESGSRYGKNVTHPSNQNETQPHWFVSRADELLGLILED